MNQHPTLTAWHHVVQHRNSDGIAALLAEDAVFWSPVVHKAQAGRAITTAYLRAAMAVLLNDSFHYVRELADDHGAVLEFEVDIEGTLVNGVDMVRWNEAGLITEFKVMLRPLRAVNLIHQKMGVLLQQARQTG